MSLDICAAVQPFLTMALTGAGFGAASGTPIYFMARAPGGATLGGGITTVSGSGNVSLQIGIYGTQSVQVDPQDTATVYVGVDKQGMFRSHDCGATWTRINTGRNGDVVGSGAQWSMALDPTNPQTLFAVNGYGKELGLWKTVDGGMNWDQMFPQGSIVAKTVEYNFVSIVSIDPTDHLHVVASMHGVCLGLFAPNCQVETLDGGVNWRLFKTQGGSGEGAGVVVLDHTTWLTTFIFDGLFRTTDSGATWTNITPKGGHGAHYQLYRSQNGPYYLGSGEGVLISRDRGLTWSLIPNSGSGLNGIVGSGKHVFVSQQNGGHYFIGSEADPTQWMPLPTQGRPDNFSGGFILAYDPDHHILYSSNQRGGLWRVVIE